MKTQPNNGWRIGLGALLLAPLVAQAQNLGDPDCGALLLVSAWRADNVKIFDACSGDYLADLDDGDRLDGPQAIVEGPSGDIYVVSENNGRVVRYARNTLEYVEVVVGDKPETEANELPLLTKPTGAAFSDAGLFYLGSFDNSQVLETNLDGAPNTRTAVPAGAGGLMGLDAGMTIGPDGALYLPGFESNSLLKADIATGETTPLLGSLVGPRGILFLGETFLVSFWGSDRIEQFESASGERLGTLSNAAPSPTGMALGVDGNVLVASDVSDDVKVLDPVTGAQIQVLIPRGSGGLFGATFIKTLAKTGPSPAAVRQFWLIGVGTISDNQIQVDDMVFTRDGAFGAGLDPVAIGREVWGSVTLTLSGCSAGDLAYAARDDSAASYGSGGYPIIRLAGNLAVEACEQQGFGQTIDNGWMAGYWYGGAPRDGEGFAVDVLAGGDQAVVTWYTYLPLSGDAKKR